MRFASLRLLCASLALAVAPAAWGEDQQAASDQTKRPIIIELFSSQGCGNCVKANANVAKLAERPDVIALTYPVGYWDYLGWDDTFAKPEFTERQKRYNRALKHRGPYTPQVVYSGRLHGSGVDLQKIEAKLAIRDVTPYPTTVSFDKDTVVVSGAALAKPEDKGFVVLVRFKKGTTTITPGGGANKGKTMTYMNLVTGFEPLGEWTGGVQKFTAKCPTGCVALVQRAGTEGAIIGAAQKK